LFNELEVIEWEEELLQKKVNRIFATSKDCFDPRTRKLNDYRHHRRTKYWYSHENKYIRNLTQRKFRRKMRTKLLNEEFFQPVPHDYKTYGWITW